MVVVKEVDGSFLWGYKRGATPEPGCMEYG